MKQLLASLMIIAVVGTAVGGTLATFSDTETSTGNTITAGTLDLTVVTDGALPGAAVPGSFGTRSWTLTNTGTIDGVLIIRGLVDPVKPDVTFTKGAEPEPETSVVGNNAGGNGDLDSFLGVAVTYSLDGALEEYTAGAVTFYEPASVLAAALADAGGAIPAGKTLVVKMYWTIGLDYGIGADAGPGEDDVRRAGPDGKLGTDDDVQVNDNIIQGDGMTLDIDFRLTQG